MYPKDMGANPNPPNGDVDARLQFLLQSTESLHASMQELHASTQELHASTQELRASTQELRASTQELRATASAQTAQLQIDAENIRRLANIAGAHQDGLEDLGARLTRLEQGKKP
jgi:methyl-accepting chemotaxis protein